MATIYLRAINAVNGDVYYENTLSYSSSEYVTEIWIGTLSGVFTLQITAKADGSTKSYETTKVPFDTEILGKKYQVTGAYFNNDGELYELNLYGTSSTYVQGTFYGDIDIYFTYEIVKTGTIRCFLDDHVHDAQQIGIEEYEYTDVFELYYINVGSTTINNVHYDYIASAEVDVDGNGHDVEFTSEIPETFNGHKFTGVKLYVDGIVTNTEYFEYGVNTLIDHRSDPISGNMFNIYIQYAIDNEGYYTFKTYNGDTIDHFDKAGYIEHYILNVVDNLKELTLTITSYNNDDNVWESKEYNLAWETDPGDGYVFDGLIDKNGDLVFIPGEYDVNIYGTYEFTESYTDTDKTRFTIELSKIKDVNKNTLNKELLHIATINGKLKDKCDITDPVILIEYNEENETFKSNILNANYCYIKLFGRYYFVQSVEIYRTNLYILHLHIDVLETYKDLILNSKAMISRSTSNYNPLIFDNEIAQLNGQTVTVEKLSYNENSPRDINSNDYIDITGDTDNECFWLFTVLGDNE